MCSLKQHCKNVVEMSDSMTWNRISSNCKACSTASSFAFCITKACGSHLAKRIKRLKTTWTLLITTIETTDRTIKLKRVSATIERRDAHGLIWVTHSAVLCMRTARDPSQRKTTSRTGSSKIKSTFVTERDNAAVNMIVAVFVESPCSSYLYLSP